MRAIESGVRAAEEATAKCHTHFISFSALSFARWAHIRSNDASEDECSLIRHAQKSSAEVPGVRVLGSV